MTYRQLLEQLDNLEDEQLDEEAMACVDEEMYVIADVKIYEGEGRLRDGYPYLEVL